MHAVKIAVSGLALLFSLNSFAANVPEGFDKAKWEQLTAKILASQNVMQIKVGELRILQEIVPADTSKDHHSLYISALGNYNDLQKFEVEDISAIDEDWKLGADGIWVFDQWTYHMNAAGDLTGVKHVQVTEKNGQVLDYKDFEPGSPQDKDLLQRWGTLLQYWTSK